MSSKSFVEGDRIKRSPNYQCDWWRKQCSRYKVDPLDSFTVIRISGDCLFLEGIGAGPEIYKMQLAEYQNQAEIDAAVEELING